MKVWIEQDYCTGDGLCEDLCPDMFKMGEDAVAHVKGEGGADAASPGVEVPPELEGGVLDAQAQCAGECIYTR